jgi:sugar phosphate isomerase/epimerase
MKIAGSTLIFTKLPLLAAIDQVAALGFKHVDMAVFEGWANLSPSAVVGREAEVGAQIQETCAQAGISPVAFNVNLGESSVEVQEERLHSVGMVAQRLGVKVLAMKTSKPAVRSVEDEIKRLGRLAHVGVAQGIQITVESHVDTYSEDPNRVLEFMRAVPDLKFTLDLTHFLVGPFREQGYGELLPYIRHAHLRDTGPTRGALQVPLGQGIVDFEKLILDLNRSGLVNAVSVEIVDVIAGIENYSLEAQRLKARVAEILARHHIPGE